jgi:hypothetical protein
LESDVRLYNYQLSRNVGAEGLVLLTVLVQTSAGICESDAMDRADESASHHSSFWHLCSPRGSVPNNTPESVLTAQPLSKENYASLTHASSNRQRKSPYTTASNSRRTSLSEATLRSLSMSIGSLGYGYGTAWPRKESSSGPGEVSVWSSVLCPSLRVVCSDWAQAIWGVEQKVRRFAVRTDTRLRHESQIALVL